MIYDARSEWEWHATQRGRRRVGFWSRAAKRRCWRFEERGRAGRQQMFKDIYELDHWEPAVQNYTIEVPVTVDMTGRREAIIRFN